MTSERRGGQVGVEDDVLCSGYKVNMSKTYVSELAEKTGQEVVLKGWVARRRDLGKLIFIDLQDSTGMVQIVCDDSATGVRNEDVVQINGIVQARQIKEGDV